MVTKVAVSAGHGKYTAGKRTPDDEREWSFNNKMAMAFIEELKNYSDVETKLVSDPTGEKDVPLTTRVSIANKWGADLYVSFHHNANTGKWGTWTGTETYTYNGKTNPRSVKVAKILNDAIVKAYGLKNRGLKTANFQELRTTKMPAVLTEGGYMDSTIDIKVMRNDVKVIQAGINCAQGIASEYKLKRKSGSVAKEETINPAKGTVHVVKAGDTLYSIAKNQNISVDELKKINSINNNLITVGQKLKLTKSLAVDSTYKIKSGDTLYSIAKDHKTTVVEIKKTNKLTSDIISVGKTLIISSASKSSQSPSPATPKKETPKANPKPKPKTPKKEAKDEFTGDKKIQEVQKFIVAEGQSVGSYGTNGHYGKDSHKGLVKVLQTEVNKQYKKKLVVDGLFGGNSKKSMPNDIKKGAKGNITKSIQGMLIFKGYDVNGFDGIFGGGLETAVKKFQKDNKLRVDGIVGQDTFEALFKN